MSNNGRNLDGDPSVALSAHDCSVLESASVLNGAAEILAELPNDLVRLIYLASIRDYNTGTYLQAELSRRYGTVVVDQVLRLHHERVFRNLLEAPVRAYVDQLVLYISFAGAPRAELIETWKGLKAYSCAIPLQCDSLAAELFCWNVLSALCILERAG